MAKEIKLNKEKIEAFNKGEITALQLLEKYSINDIAEALAKLLVPKEAPKTVAAITKTPKIAVSEEEFERIKEMFRVKLTGTGRGRKPKSEK